MIKGFLKYSLFLFLALSLSSCIENDIPYPKKLGKITAFEVSGQIGASVIDSTKLTISLELSDTVDVENVRVIKMEVPDKTTFTPALSQYINMLQPVKYTLKTYPDQEYLWTISAKQVIERYVKVDNQVGKAEFDVDNKIAIVFVTKSQNLKDMKINDVKLGPSNSVIEPDPRTITDYSTLRYFTVSYRNIKETWAINVVIKDVELITNPADAWATHSFLSGRYVQGMGNPTFSYRRSDDTQWTLIPEGDVKITDIDFSYHLTGLTPNTKYLYKAVVGTNEGEEVEFITEKDTQMPNMSFDDWVSNIIGGKKTWFPNLDTDANYWWDSGNIGANTIGEKNPTTPEETFVKKGKAARMETVSVVGQMAGGNVFSGKFVETILIPRSGAKVDFGRPFTTRPSKLRGYYSYEPKEINKVKDPYKYLLGKSDRCHIFLMLFDRNIPYSVNTAQGTYLPPYTDDNVIGYADLVDSVGTGGAYKEFSLDIIYKDKRKPGYCALVAVASYYADYFTGGVGSLLFADEFSFIYDSEVKWK